MPRTAFISEVFKQNQGRALLLLHYVQLLSFLSSELNLEGKGQD